MCGPRQLFLFQCGPETLKGWAPLVGSHRENNADQHLQLHCLPRSPDPATQRKGSVFRADSRISPSSPSLSQNTRCKFPTESLISKFAFLTSILNSASLRQNDSTPSPSIKPVPALTRHSGKTWKSCHTPVIARAHIHTHACTPSCTLTQARPVQLAAESFWSECHPQNPKCDHISPLAQLPPCSKPPWSLS